MSDALYRRLEPTARELRAQAYPLARAVAAYEGGTLPDDDFVALSESSAFLAFTTMGGNVDDPESFDWTAHHRDLVRLGLTFLRADLGHAYLDWAKGRGVPRKDGRCVSEIAWDAWQRHEIPQHDTAQWGINEFEPDLAFRDSMLAMLEPLVAETLGLVSARVVCDHYFRGISQRAIAERMAADAGFTGNPDAIARAERVVNKTVSRARAKLRKVLPPEWWALAREVA